MSNVLSHRDYWVLKMSDGNMVMLSRSSASGLVVGSITTPDGSIYGPVPVDVNPDEITVGFVFEGNDGHPDATVVEVIVMPRLATTASTRRHPH